MAVKAMRIQRLTKDAKENLLEDLLKRSPNNYGQYEQGVQEILAHVKEEKDQAVFAYTKKFDHADITADNIKVTEEEIEEYCMKLPRYKRPKKIIFADVPRNATGKIEKPALRKKYGAEYLVAQQNRA